MFWTKRVVIGDAERGLVYRNRRFERVLAPGVHRIRDPLNRVEVRTVPIAVPEYTGSDVDVLIARLGAHLAETFVLADIGTDEVGLVLKNGKLEDVLAPGTRRLYWRGLVDVAVQRLSLADGLELPRDVFARLRQLGTLSRVAVTADVPAESNGLLFVDGTLQRTLAPGAYGFWNFQKNVAVEVVDLRVQSVEVSGQELLTRDKVSLRVNLAASVRVVDAVAARTKVAKASDAVYRELQYGLRRVVSARTLDELLGDKASLDADIFAYARHGGRLRHRGVGRRRQGLDPAGRNEGDPQRRGAGREAGAGQRDPSPRGGERDALAAQHRAPRRGEPHAHAPEGVGGAGEGHREDRQAHRVRRPGWRAEAACDDEALTSMRPDGCGRIELSTRAVIPSAARDCCFAAIAERVPRCARDDSFTEWKT